MGETPREHSCRRRVDVVTALMTVVTVTAIVGAAWLRYGPASSRARPAAGDVSVGAEAPPLRLLDLETSEPMVLLGVGDRVMWVVFWSADSASGRACLPELEAAWKKLKAHRRFALVTAAVEADDPGVVRAAVAASGVDLPVYLASPETRRRFHAQAADPPLHVVIDAGGQVVTMARHAGQSTIDRIAKQVRHRLDELDPIGETRFAARGGCFCDSPGCPSWTGVEPTCIDSRSLTVPGDSHSPPYATRPRRPRAVAFRGSVRTASARCSRRSASILWARHQRASST